MECDGWVDVVDYVATVWGTGWGLVGALVKGGRNYLILPDVLFSERVGEQDWLVAAVTRLGNWSVGSRMAQKRTCIFAEDWGCCRWRQGTAASPWGFS